MSGEGEGAGEAPPRPRDFNPSAVALWLDRRRIGAAAAILLVFELAFFAFIVAGTHGWIVPLSQPTTTDFVSFYAAGALADAGTPALAYDHAVHLAAEERVTGANIEYQFFNYPPVYLLLCALLAPLPYLVAFILFETATLALYLFVAVRILGERGAAAVLPLLAFPIVFWNYGLGQNAFLTAALFGAATLLLDCRPFVAGLLFGALCYKPQFGLLLPLALIAGREWRAFAGAAVCVVGLVLLSLVLSGTGTWLAFFQTVGASQSMYASGRILFAGMANPFGAVLLMGGSPSLAHVVQVAAMLAAAALVIAVWARRLPLPTRAAVLAAATVAAAPLVLLYDLILAGIAALWLVRSRSSPAAAPWERTALAAIFLLILVFGHPRLIDIWRVPVFPLVALALFAVVAGRVWREWAIAGTGSPRVRTGETREEAAVRSQ